MNPDELQELKALCDAAKDTDSMDIPTIKYYLNAARTALPTLIDNHEKLQHSYTRLVEILRLATICLNLLK